MDVIATSSLLVDIPSLRKEVLLFGWAELFRTGMYQKIMVRFVVRVTY